MKPGTRRLGRGLGAFLDFGPSGDDAPGYSPQVADAETKSILETSVAQATPVRAAVKPSPVAPKPPPPPAPRPAPVATASPAPPPPAPSPPPPAQRVQVEPAQASRPQAAEPVFVDEVFEGLSFPDVELE